MANGEWRMGSSEGAGRRDGYREAVLEPMITTPVLAADITTHDLSRSPFARIADRLSHGQSKSATPPHGGFPARRSLRLHHRGRMRDFLRQSLMLQAVMIPFLIFALAAIGLNVLTGYAGLLSLGTGAFMGVGAYACYKLTTAFPEVNILVWILASGFFSAAVGVLFGLPSLRIKGFYLAVATLAAQFFLQWASTACPVALQLQRLRRDRGAAADAVRRSHHRRDGDAPDALRGRADARHPPHLVRLQPRPRPHRPHVDGDPRHGHRRRAHGHQALAGEAPRLRGFVLSIAAWPAP